jgi:SAM-dependent methyltransferase
MGWRDKRKIMQSYDVTAEMYDERYSEEQARKYDKALENVIVTSKSVLDVGCGSGLFFCQVADKADIVVGVDLSRKLLTKAKKHSKAFNVLLFCRLMPTIYRLSIGFSITFFLLRYSKICLNRPKLCGNLNGLPKKMAGLL